MPGPLFFRRLCESMYQTEERQRNIEKVIKTARELFLQEGVMNISVNRIAQESGLSAMSLYRYFGTREDLILAVWKDALDEFYTRFNRRYKQKYDPSDTGLQKFLACMDTYIEAYTKHPEWYDYTKEMMGGFAGRRVNDEDFWNKFYSWITIPAMKAMQEGQKDGSIRPDVNLLEAYQLIHNVYTGTNITQHFTKDVHPTDIIRFTTDLLANYMRNE